MNSKTFLCAAAVAVLLCLTISSVEGGKGGWGMDKKCKGEDMKNSEGMKDVMKKCFSEMKKSRETRDAEDTTEGTEGKKKRKGGKGGKGGFGKRACMMVCIMKEQKMLTADGKYDASGTEAYIKDKFPSAAQADLKKAFDTCNETHGKSFSMDNDCKGYQEFAMCTRKSMKEVCGWKGGKGKRGGKGKKGKGGAATTEASDDQGEQE